MCGADTFTHKAFMLHCLEDFVPPARCLHPIRQSLNKALDKMIRLFASVYEADIMGRKQSLHGFGIVLEKAFTLSKIITVVILYFYPFGQTGLARREWFCSGPD